MNPIDPLQQYVRPHEWSAHTQTLLDSYRHWIGKDLIPRSGTVEQQADALFLAARVVVSHDDQADPLLTYANHWALQLWEMDIETLLRTPSRLTAEPMHRDERAKLLQRTSADGYVDDYQGIRISRTGHRFLIRQATVWNLVGPSGRHVGQAATFDAWQPVGQAGALDD